MLQMESNVNQKVSCVANYTYEASEADELSLRPGDLLRDVERLPGGWWRGELRGKRGMFPDNFVSVVNEHVPDRSSGVQGRCRAVFSYQPANPDELPLCVGDVLEVLAEVEEGWWQGRRQGRVGVFPSNFVVMLEHAADGAPSPTPSPDAAPAPALPPKPVKELCRVLFPYAAVNEDELTLAEGDVVTVISKDAPDRGWWRGELHGRSGLFPDNFVQLLPPGTKSLREWRACSRGAPIPHKLETMIADKRRLRRQWMDTRCPTMKRKLNSLVAKIRTGLDEHARGGWQAYIDAVSGAIEAEEKKPERPSKNIYPILNKYSEKTSSLKETKISSHKESTLNKETNSHKDTIVTHTNKSESEKFLHSESVTDGSPDPQVKKPPVPMKKSPTPASGVGGLFSGLKSKMLSTSDKEKSATVSSSGSSSSGEWDKIDGGAASKPASAPSAPASAPTAPATNSGNTFDHVERNSILNDPRASRVKAPRRRPPSQVLRDDLPLQIGLSNGHEADKSSPSPAPEAGEEIKPRAREWEKHRAPWMEELKLNQARKTVGADGKATGSTDRILDCGLEERKTSTHSMEMSKSTSSITSRISVLESFEESKVRHSLDSNKKDTTSTIPEPVASRNSLHSPTAQGRTLISMVEEVKKPPAPSPPSASARAPPLAAATAATAAAAPLVDKPSEKLVSERSTSEEKAVERNEGRGSVMERIIQSSKSYEKSEGADALINQLNNRILNLEKLLEVQNAKFSAAIEQLQAKLAAETERRQALQSQVEKLAHCVTQV